MPYSVRYKPAAAAEVAHAIGWYGQPHIDQAAAFIRELELQLTETHLASHPTLYQRVEGEIRRAVLRRFPYAPSFVIESELVLVLACMHHHQTPRSRGDLLGST